LSVHPSSQPIPNLTQASDSTITNLHHIWDSNIPEKLVGGHTIPFATSWSKNLTTSIKSGKYKSQAAAWLAGTTLSDASSTAMIWARDTNAYVCSAVLPNGITAVENTDLGGDYYSGVISVVEMQIAKGAVTNTFPREEFMLIPPIDSWVPSSRMVKSDGYGKDGSESEDDAFETCV
jgi:hypothetical protein